MRIRVLTFNVQNEEGDPRRTALIGRELRRLAPDIVALQEVRHPGQLATLLDGTGLTATHQESLRLDPPAATTRFGGTALATRLPHTVVDVTESEPASAHHWWTLTVSLAGGLRVVTPTTPWEPSAGAARLRQARDIVDRTGAGPVIVAGDLNAPPESASVRLLTGVFRDTWATAGDGPGHTWTVDNPLGRAAIEQTGGGPGHRSRIDYVLATPATIHPTGVRLVGTAPVDGVWLSDHYGVLADLAVEE